MDRLVADVFGFHALQLGLPELDGLRCNRMPHKWLALDNSYARWQPPADRAPLIHDPLVLPEGLMHGAPLGVRCEFEALPLASSSLDLVVLPHALELARDPHATLREVERVLVPEGRVVIAGFNPASLWGASQRLGLWGITLPWCSRKASSSRTGVYEIGCDCLGSRLKQVALGAIAP